MSYSISNNRGRPGIIGRYLKVSLGLLVLIFFVGMMINHLLIDNDQKVATTVVDGRTTQRELIDYHFEQAIDHMQHRQYEQAVAEWHKVLLLNPDIPEVQVNMGFALYELGRYEMAREFFISAMEREAYQANAYYGLAIVSEKLGDIEGAMGAMRSYIHLAGDDESFLRKARSALWEWESQIATDKRSTDKAGNSLPDVAQ